MFFLLFFVNKNINKVNSLKTKTIGPTGFLPIDPNLHTCQRGDDMGRKAGLKGALTKQPITGFLDCFVPRNDAKRVNDAK